ncbi:MAG: hypothetical protein KAJ91_03690 [Candidatus Aenigmarchaeota archaeon]|nr:hypothetical protein [Candidatus Aenigmarchaeota archaeon]
MKIVPKWVASMGDSCFQTKGSFQFYDGHLGFYAGDTANRFQKEGCPQPPRFTEENYPNSGAVNRKNVDLWIVGLQRKPDLGDVHNSVKKIEELTSLFYSDEVYPNEGKALSGMADIWNSEIAQEHGSICKEPGISKQDKSPDYIDYIW